MSPNQHFSLRFIKKIGLLRPFAFTVTTQGSKKAVTRNLIKRRGRALLRKISPVWRKETLVVFSALVGSDTLTYAQMEEEIVFLLKRARMV